MGMVLRPDKYIQLPGHSSGGYDHADVYRENGWVYLAHPATGSVEVVDGARGRHVKTIHGCPEASGVVCAQKEGLVFAASRGTGKVLVISAAKGTVTNRIQAGSKPNGLAWDGEHYVLLVVDVGDQCARLVDADRGRVLFTARMPGRPRWCEYSAWNGKFIINIRDPSGIVALNPRTGEVDPLRPVSQSWPHGLEIDERANRAYVGCDSGALVVYDLDTLTEKGVVWIPQNSDVLWLNPDLGRLYCAVANPGLISVVDTRSLRIVEEVRTEEGAGSLTFDPERGRLYSFHPKACRAVVYVEA